MSQGRGKSLNKTGPPPKKSHKYIETKLRCNLCPSFVTFDDQILTKSHLKTADLEDNGEGSYCVAADTFI